MHCSSARIGIGRVYVYISSVYVLAARRQACACVSECTYRRRPVPVCSIVCARVRVCTCACISVDSGVSVPAARRARTRGGRRRVCTCVAVVCVRVPALTAARVYVCSGGVCGK